MGKGQHFLLGQCGLDVVIQVDALAVVRVVQSVGIRLLQCVRPIPGGQRHQRGTGYALTKQKLPHAASSRQGAAIGKVQIIGPGNVHIDNVLGHPPEMRGAVGGQHPALHFAFQTDGKSGSVTIQCSA